MNLQESLIDSWRRQCACLDNLLTLVDGPLLQAKPSDDGWTIAVHLCHLHMCRLEWLEKASGRDVEGAVMLWHLVDGAWHPSSDYALIRSQLGLVSKAMTDWLGEVLGKDLCKAGPYDNPVFYLQHMMWHEGYHFGLLMLALRRAGIDPPEEWEEPNIWGLWREEGA